jgi:transposase-like protein
MARPYATEFRDEVVRLARSRDDGVTLELIATDFGVHLTTLTKWLRQADTNNRSDIAEATFLTNRRRHPLNGLASLVAEIYCPMDRFFGGAMQARASSRSSRAVTRSGEMRWAGDPTNPTFQLTGACRSSRGRCDTATSTPRIFQGIGRTLPVSTARTHYLPGRAAR